MLSLRWATMVVLVTLAFPTHAAGADDRTKQVLAPPKGRRVVEIPSKGLALKGTYYSGGRTSVPMVLFHGYRGARGDLASLAEMLHRDGHAVLLLIFAGMGKVQNQRDLRRFPTNSNRISRES